MLQSSWPVVSCQLDSFTYNITSNVTAPGNGTALMTCNVNEERKISLWYPTRRRRARFMHSLNWRKTRLRSNKFDDFSNIFNSLTLFHYTRSKWPLHTSMLATSALKIPIKMAQRRAIFRCATTRFSLVYNMASEPGGRRCWKQVGQLVREGRGFSWRAYERVCQTREALIAARKDRSQTWPRDRTATAATGETFLSPRFMNNWCAKALHCIGRAAHIRINPRQVATGAVPRAIYTPFGESISSSPTSLVIQTLFFSYITHLLCAYAYSMT